ncbi:hypothetical protein NDU88_008648 [Pleurodeles waltl]|uniref:Uncharacterized protein n=1 Tax=Pleurodeles waltl TaxID=8319 RepID=A0AAV7N5N3_PLEWA|nr:hypothetical protein NDU88_008648 [Pleurodeles waltl]
MDSWCSVCLSAISQPAAHGLLVLCVSLCHLSAGCSWTPGALCVSAISQPAPHGFLVLCVSLCHCSAGFSQTPGAVCLSVLTISRAAARGLQVLRIRLLVGSWCSVCLSAISQRAARGLLVLCVSLCHLSAGCSWTPGALCVSLPSLSQLLVDTWCSVRLPAISQLAARGLLVPAARGLLVLCVSLCHLSAGCSWTPGALCVSLPSLSRLLVDSWCSVCLSAISQPAARGLLVLCVSLCHLSAGCSSTPGALCVSLPSLSRLLVDSWCSVCLSDISQSAARRLLVLCVPLCHLSAGCSWTPSGLCVSLSSLSWLLADC